MISVYHRLITRAAIGNGVNRIALATILNANIYQDRPAGQVGHAEFHFDDSAFEAAYSYLEGQRQDILSSLTIQRDSPAAWKAFGRLTHGAQDFYAHSNYVPRWVEAHPGTPPEAIEPLDPGFLTADELRSGHVYLPWEIFTYLPVIGQTIRRLIPHDSHAWMNLDSPASGTLFAYARIAAIKRTKYAFDHILMDLMDRGGSELVCQFTGLDRVVS